jgi:hypothetical protein
MTLKVAMSGRAQPRAVVLVPLPHRAFDRGLGVDLGVIDVDPVVLQHLLHRPQEARRADQGAEGLAAGRAVRLVDAEDGAHAAGVLAHHLVGLHLGEPRHLAAQHGDLVALEQVGEDQEPVAIELLDLGRRQLHGASSAGFCRR